MRESALVEINKFADALSGEPEIVRLKTENAALQARLDACVKALEFYAGYPRSDSNGFEFDREPKLIQGGVAREALAAAKEQRNKQ